MHLEFFDERTIKDALSARLPADRSTSSRKIDCGSLGGGAFVLKDDDDDDWSHAKASARDDDPREILEAHPRNLKCIPYAFSIFLRPNFTALLPRYYTEKNNLLP